MKRKISHAAILQLLLALLFMGIGLWMVLMQLQTSEAMLSGRGCDVKMTMSSVMMLQQPWNLFFAGYTIVESVIIVAAWTIEVLYFSAVWKFEKCMVAMQKMGPINMIYIIGVCIGTLYNFISDFQCGTAFGTGLAGQLLFACLALVATACFLGIGLFLIIDLMEDSK
jgi:hypothetical protein